MGVWIETTSVLPFGARGLRVTPRVGVWIETVLLSTLLIDPESLPAWECGLKLFGYKHMIFNILSLPAWECGLKLFLNVSKFFEISHSPRGSVD